MLTVTEVVTKGFTLGSVKDSSEPRIRFTGNCDFDAVEPLGKFLRLVDDEMLTKKYVSVSIDLEELFFMNSSCLKAMVSWIYGINEAGQPYTIRLLTNPSLHWQKRTMRTLQRLAPQVVEIEELVLDAPQ
jgi:hypothetical protein